MKFMDVSLRDADTLVYEIVKRDSERQKNKLLLNAATSITPPSIMEIQGSILDNIDAEGYIPDYLACQSLEELSDIDIEIELYEKYRDNRFNKCCEYANIIEALAIKRLAKAYENNNAKAEDIHVNVQVPTGALANEIVYEALLKPGDTIISLGTRDGGHTTHGDEEHQSYDKYKIINYHINPSTGEINYDEIASLLKTHSPQMIIAGASAYPLSIEWSRIREMIDEFSPGTLFLSDIAHTAGLVAGGAFNNPLGISDVTTMVGYKTFCGPRAAAIMTTKTDLAKKIDKTVFPKVMGSPLLLGIAGLAVASGIALTEEYKDMQHRIIDNSRELCSLLMSRGLDVIYGRTDSHIVLLNCKGYGTGREMMDILEDCNILVNCVQVPSGDGYNDGLRLGTTAVTQMGITRDGLKEIANVISDVFIGIQNKKSIDRLSMQSRVAKVIERETR